MKKGFTLVEMTIVIIIIGLLAGMAIPAFQKVRQSSLVKAYEKGQKLTKEELVIVSDFYKNHPENIKRSRRSSDVEEYKTIIIDGKTYKLVPE